MPKVEFTIFYTNRYGWTWEANKKRGTKWVSICSADDGFPTPAGARSHIEDFIHDLQITNYKIKIEK